MKTFWSKTILILSFIIMYAPAVLKAQVFNEGDNIISVGYGFGIVDLNSLVGIGDQGSGGTNTYLGPIYLKYEHAVSNKVTIGINVAYGQYKTEYTENYNINYQFGLFGTYSYEETYTTFSVLARLNWHFGRLNKFDPYWGFGLGYRSGSYTYRTNDPSGSDSEDFGVPFPLGFELTIGARYYLTDVLAIYMETGLAKSVAQVGASFKLR